MNPFDIQEWKPTFCKTEEELKAFWEEHQIARKKIMKINAIGIALNMDGWALGERIQETLSSAGVTDELMQKVYKDWDWYDNIQLNAELKLWEPIVLVFEDRSTVELMIFPDGVLGVSVNQIDPDTSEGTNHGDCDAGILFFEMLSRKCRRPEFCHRISYQGSGEGERVQREEYAFVFTLSGDPDLRFFIRAGHDSAFTCGLISRYQFNWEQNIHKIPMGRINDSLKDIRQIPILEGENTSSYFAICSLTVEKEEKNPRYSWETKDYYQYRMMIEEDDVQFFLFYFLYKYFDEDYNKKYAGRDSYNSVRFERWADRNLYSYPTMKKMLEEIEEKARLLQEDFENPELKELIDDFSISDFLPDELWDLPDQEDWNEEKRKEIIRDNLGIALDFYARFVKRVRKLMERNPDSDCICFTGP